MSLDFSDSIAGIATAPGQGGIAVIRLSGPQALRIAEKIFYPAGGRALSRHPKRKMVYGWVKEQNITLDEALACYMPGPQSFTAEDVVELHAHGGIYLSRRILEQCLSQGARLARPGEFTQRAFINGRIDLTRAEAIGQITEAKTALGLELSVNQLKGRLYEKIQSLKEKLQWVQSLVNASIDFPEEGVVFFHSSDIQNRLIACESELVSLLERSKNGILVREGFKAALTGRPNVGKSSLLNALLQEDRAIVTATPGTTRDVIEEGIDLMGIPLILTDTAGIRKTEDQVEQAGISKSIKALEQADIVLWIVDATNPDMTLLQEEAKVKANKPVFLIVNKRDQVGRPPELHPPLEIVERIDLCALRALDMIKLKERLGAYLQERVSGVLEETGLTNLRQQAAAQSALKALRQANACFKEAAGEELLSVDLAQTLSSLGEIVGETTPEEILNGIFANFCIGK